MANYRRGQMDYWFAKPDGRSMETELSSPVSRRRR